MKRPIDIKRDSGGRFSVGEGTGNIVAQKSLGDRLLIVSQRGVHSVQMADQIDPGRTNINVPQVVQRIELNRGAESEVVSWTLLAAMEVLDQTHLPEGFPVADAVKRALKVAKQLCEVEDVAADVAAVEASTRAAISEGRLDPARLPATPNLRGRCEHAINQARQCFIDLAWLTDLFHPRQRKQAKWHEALESHLVANVGEDHHFRTQLPELLRRINQVHNYRNAVIHADEVKSVDVYDYDLQPDMTIVAPTLQIHHPDTPVQRQDIVRFLRSLTNEVAWVFEAFLGNLADLNARQLGPFGSRVVALPEGEHRSGSRLVWEVTVPEGFEFPPPPKAP
jgi:hypothetical protein